MKKLLEWHGRLDYELPGLLREWLQEGYVLNLFSDIDYICGYPASTETLKYEGITTKLQLAAGALTIPQSLRERAGIIGPLTIIAISDYFEIWSEGAYEECLKRKPDDYCLRVDRELVFGWPELEMVPLDNWIIDN